MRLRRRSSHERNDRTAKGECRHVWRVRDLTGALSGATCQVCERCGAMHVDKTDQPTASTAVPHQPSSSTQDEGTALESLARRWSLPTDGPGALEPISPLG
jgi:hypothetical protein